MQHKPVTILAFLALGIWLAVWPPQYASARLTEGESDDSTPATSRWLALPLVIEDVRFEVPVSSDFAADEDHREAPAEVVVEKPLHWNPPGEVEVPILMYHHVADFDPPFRYATPLQSFEEQMQSLHSWGYTTIPIAKVVEAITVGAYLPERPIVLTFDDGYMDVYENAFPILQAYGFQGVAYIIAGQVEIGGFMHAQQLKDLLSAGWEIGSHTYNHVDLSAADSNLQFEIVDAKNDLEALIDGPVDTFSFPYGLTTPYATSLVDQTGFQSAVGLGGLSRHVLATRLYLSRIEVQGDVNLNDFVDLLPWAGPLGAQEPFDGSDQ